MGDISKTVANASQVKNIQKCPEGPAMSCLKNSTLQNHGHKMFRKV